MASAEDGAESSKKSDSCSFDALCDGANGYVCDPSCLVDLVEVDKSTPIPVATKFIKDKLDSIIRVLEIRRSGYVKILHIGKACIKKRKTKGGEYQTLDRMDPATWIRKFIGSHWCRQRSKGRDGMIVLTAVTRETIPNGINQYALELQQKLVEIYKTDTKVLEAEKHKKDNADGYVLYAAFNIEWTRFSVPAANLSMHNSFGFEAIDNDEDEDDVQHEPSHEPVIDNNEDSHPLVRHGLTLVIPQQVNNQAIPLVIPMTSHPPTSEQSSTNTTSLGNKRSLFSGCQDTDPPRTKIQKVSFEEHHIESPLSVTTSESTTTRKPYSSLVGAAKPKRSAIKISLAANPEQVPSLSKNKLTQGPQMSFPPTRPPSQAAMIPAVEIPPLTPLSPNEAVTPSLDSNAMAAMPTSIPYANPSDTAIFGSPPSPPVPTNVTVFPPSVTFNISDRVTVSPTRAIPPVHRSPQKKQTSVASRTTLGGCTFEYLCNQPELKNYVCDASCLVDLSKTNAVDEVVRLIAEKLEDNIRELEIARDGKVTKIYIGKTFITQRRKRGGGHGFQQFDPMQPNTWKKNGISSRWGSHKTFGRHGLIVLTAVTREIVPKGFNQQDYALMLEQKLIHRYKLNNDVRLENETSSEGGRTKNLTHGYALYVALTIEEEDTPIFTDDDNDHDDNAALTSLEPNQAPTTSGLPYTNTIVTFPPTLSAIAGSSTPQFTQPDTKHMRT